MTDKTKRIEEEFNKSLPSIPQAAPGTVKRDKFDKDRFLKAARELQRVVKDNDRHEAHKS